MTATLSQLTAELLASPMSHARAHRSRGGRVIGFISADVPVELLLAANALPLGLTAITERPTPQADRYLEPSFAPLERSIAEQWISGDLSFLSEVVLTRARDSSQRLYYYICELQRRGLCPGPAAVLHDVAKIDRATSREYTFAATRRLAEELGSDLTRLSDCVQVRNRRRQLLGELQGLRCRATPPAGSFVQRVLRASDQTQTSLFDEALTEWLRQEVAITGAAPALRVALTGSMPPDHRLHEAVESAGGCVVVEYGDHAVERLGAPIPTSGAVLESVSAHYQKLHYGPRIFGTRAADLVEVVRKARAQVVVLWLLEEEEALIWNLPAQLQALTEASIPFLVLTRRRWRAEDDALERIRAFILEQQARK